VSIPGRVLNGGTASGQILRLSAPLSFWGGFDPSTGTIIDRAHPQVGKSVAGMILAMPGSRGSAGTPGALGESIRLGTGPKALIITKADINLTAGALVAEALYDTQCPVILVDLDDFEELQTSQPATISADGTIEIQDQPQEP
jgi:predicted aconitase with swiveling domain